MIRSKQTRTPAPSFETYSETFINFAHQQRATDTQIESCLRYARPLLNRGLPPVFDIDHLCHLVGYENDYLLGAAYRPEKYYRTFEIEKRSGGVRQISEPLPGLKEIQNWLYVEVLSRVPVSECAKAFVAGRSIKDNALLHRKQEQVLSLDLKDFFPSIARFRVFGLFRSFGYSKVVTNILSRLCTLNNALPQGAPTSPAISNLIAARLDRRLLGLARKLNLRYSRYADDLTFSGEFDSGWLVMSVRAIALDEGFQLNEGKTRLMRRHQRQEVTGVVVNERLNARRELRRELRQLTYYIDKYGVEGHLNHIGELRAGFISHCLGLCSHVLHLSPGDIEARKLKDTLLAGS